MKLLIDIGHPAHVHLFKCFAQAMQLKGHDILFTCRDKEFEIQLLNHYGFLYISFGKKFRSTFGKIVGMLKFDFQSIKASLKFKPDIFLSHGSIIASHTAFLLNKPHITFEDTFNFEQIKLYEPFTDVILTSDYDHPLKSKKVIKYPGYNELAYLHPNRFKPDKFVLDELGIKENEPYVIIRFVSWQASHDVGHKGISFEHKIKAVKAFSEYARVFISSESPLPVELQPFRFSLPPHRMHDAIAFSSLVFGESSTMSEEAAMLGVPSVYLFTNSTFYTQHLEKDYGLMFNFSESESDQQMAIDKGVGLLQQVNLREEWQKSRAKMLADKIDVTAFMLWLVENYPHSKHEIVNTKAFWDQFR